MHLVPPNGHRSRKASLRLCAAACVLVLAAGVVAEQPEPSRVPDTPRARRFRNRIRFNAPTTLPSDEDTPPPTKIDLRATLDNWGLPTRNQGPRPTCSVFATTAAIEYALASRDRRGTRLSVEYLNWASNQATGDSDDGSFFSDLWAGFCKYGICLEEEMPYQAKFDPERAPSEVAFNRAMAIRDSGLQLHWIKRWNRNRGLTEAEFLEVKEVLAKQWPVSGGFLWPKKTEWDNGVLKMRPRPEVFDGHSILLVGFRDDDKLPGGGAFIIRNSGGEEHEGMMSYEYVKAYMNDAIWIDFQTNVEPAPQSRPTADLLNPAGSAPAGRSRRVSSNEQPKWHDGDDDRPWLLPGQSAEMPLLKGPGIITHMWFTTHAAGTNELDTLTLRIFYDGSKTPGVEAPLGHFFGVGDTPAEIESVPVQVSPTGSMSCYWRIPFRQSARIVVTNDNPDRATGIYYQVDYTELGDMPADTPYFYAKYRQEFPAVGGRDYLLADLGGTGYYVGTVLSVTQCQDGWFGEGDDFFYVDGEEVPSIQGTGTEDYFNDAWGFRARKGMWFGQSRWQGTHAGDNGVAYRWHVPDAVNFNKSLKVAIEHKGNCEDDSDGFFVERPDFMSSVAFWYQTGQPKAWEEYPSAIRRRVPWECSLLVKAFQQAQVKGESKLRIDTAGFFGARPVLAWEARSKDDALTLPFTVVEKGRYAVRASVGKGPQQGSYEVSIDDKVVVPNADLRAPEESEGDLALGTQEFTAGRHTLTFKYSPRLGPGGPISVEMLRLLKLPPEAKRAVRGDNEAHFVRLAIGRAVFAYKLAYGKLPQTLQTLVDANLLAPKHLQDENGQPLKAGLQGDAFAVESTGPGGGWKYKWQGLDARR